MIEVEGVQYVTTTEAATILGTKPQAIRKLVFAKKLQPYRKELVKENVFRLADVQALLMPKPRP